MQDRTERGLTSDGSCLLVLACVVATVASDLALGGRLLYLCTQAVVKQPQDRRMKESYYMHSVS